MNGPGLLVFWDELRSCRKTRLLRNRALTVFQNLPQGADRAGSGQFQALQRAEVKIASGKLGPHPSFDFLGSPPEVGDNNSMPAAQVLLRPMVKLLENTF